MNVYPLESDPATLDEKSFKTEFLEAEDWQFHIDRTALPTTSVFSAAGTMLPSAEQPWSYIQRFPTEAGVQRSYELPVADFEPVGMRLDPAPEAPQTLDPSSISQVSVYILDKQQGPFAITVSGIDATV